MTDYRGNANKGKENKGVPVPEKNIEPLTLSGEVVVKPPSIGSKFKNIFFGGDFHTAAEYVASQVLLPALRNLMVETISRGADRLIYGENRPVNRGPTQTTYSPRVSYNLPVARQQTAHLPNQPMRFAPTDGHKVARDIVVGTKEDAEQIVDALGLILGQYEIVSLTDLNQLVGLPSPHVDNKWGWTSLNKTQINQTRDGWAISFPPLEEIA